MDNIDADMLAMLEVDEQRKQQEVDQIAGNALFQRVAGAVAANEHGDREDTTS